jgi:glycosyltransferase involved in cell wall biosynthesis
MKITFGIVNYNRLFYLKSCAESLMASVEDYHDDIQFICVDDNSVEPGTKEYLEHLKTKNWLIINQEDRRNNEKSSIHGNVEHIDPWAEAVNLIYENATGDLIAPLQGDMQFIRKNWLEDYVQLYKNNSDVFAAMFDAQRRIRLERSSFDNKKNAGKNTFAVESNRRIPGAGDCFYDKQTLKAIGGWHPGKKTNAEDLFRGMIERKYGEKKKVYVPWLPVAVAIYTDPRGTNGRVRGNRRYGDYWQAKDDFYYQWLDEKTVKINTNRPSSIEEVTKPNGDWLLPIDEYGNWKKRPVDTNSHNPNDYETIF